MSLTTAQVAAVKADIGNNADLNAFPNNDDGNFSIAALYNLPASPTVSVWRSDVPVQEIFDAINWALYTPVDSVPASDATLTFSDRLLLVQTKQMNLQNMTIGRTLIDAGKVNIRAGLRDAVIQVPSGVAGALTAPGGASGGNVLAACVRNATRIEALLVSNAASTTGGTTAAVMGFVGRITPQDVTAARNS